MPSGVNKIAEFFAAKCKKTIVCRAYFRQKWIDFRQSKGHSTQHITEALAKTYIFDCVSSTLLPQKGAPFFRLACHTDSR